MNMLRKEESYTVDDIYALPDGERAELIDGQIFYMSPPGRTHQKISMLLSNEIVSHVRRSKGKCEVYAAPFAVFLNRDSKNYVEPDICVVCDTEKLDEKGCHGAPDWVIEIVSPSSRMMDYYTKLFKYRDAGVREYWIADPAKKRVTVYSFEQGSMMEYLFADEIPVGIYEGFSIKMEQE